jgi:hypothetical protein
MALCDVIGSSSESGPSLARMKLLLSRRPELLTTATQMMVEMREMYVSLAAERANDREQAQLAVGLVMSALSQTLHDRSHSDRPIGEQLKAAVQLLLAVGEVEMEPARSSS